VYFHQRPDGIQDQAEFVCQELIPAAIAGHPGRKLGDVAVLYLDKNDGNVVAEAVAKTGWQFVRVDGNNPYQASPVTYWLEDCAAWCAGAWKTGDIRLSELVNRWLRFNERLSADKERRCAQVALVRFLYTNREGDIQLHDWLTLFLADGLQSTLDLKQAIRGRCAGLGGRGEWGRSEPGCRRRRVGSHQILVLSSSLSHPCGQREPGRPYPGI